MKTSFFDTEIKPYTQIAAIGGVALLVMVVHWILHKIYPSSFGLSNLYTIALAFTLVYIIFNPMLSLTSKNQSVYYGTSITSYIVLCAVTIFAAKFLSGKSMDEIGPLRWMYFVLTFSYIILLVIISSMKRIVTMAQKK